MSLIKIKNTQMGSSSHCHKIPVNVEIKTVSLEKSNKLWKINYLNTCHTSELKLYFL